VYRYTSLDSITPFPKNYTPSSYGILFLEGMAYDKEKKIPTLLKIIIKALFRTIAEERKREREGETERETEKSGSTLNTAGQEQDRDVCQKMENYQEEIPRKWGFSLTRLGRESVLLSKISLPSISFSLFLL
jgi:hypothetical protein